MPRARRAAWLVGGWILGMAATVVGAFLPWLYSGSVAKNSFQLAGVSRRQFDVPGWVDALLAGWPLVGSLWCVLLAVYAVRFRRLVLVVSIVLGVVVAAVGATVLLMSGRLDNSLIQGAAIGPAVTVGGALAVIGTALGLLAQARRAASSPTVPPNAIGPMPR